MGNDNLQPLQKSDWDFFFQYKKPYQYVDYIASVYYKKDFPYCFKKLLFWYLNFPTELQSYLYKGCKLYRARKVTKNDLRELGKSKNFNGFDESGSGAPPFVKNGGRINEQDDVMLYTANNEETAICEVLNAKNGIVSVATMELESNAHVLNIAKRYSSILSDNIQMANWVQRFILELADKFCVAYQDEEKNNETYDFCRKIARFYGSLGTSEIGFKAIAYHSAKGINIWGEGLGINCTFFNPNMAKAISSKLYFIEDYNQNENILIKREISPDECRSYFAD